MRGAAGFCRPEWLIGLPGGCEGGAVGEEAATRGEGVIVRAPAQAPWRVPPPGPLPSGSGPQEACGEMAGAAGTWVPEPARPRAWRSGPNLFAQDKTTVGPSAREGGSFLRGPDRDSVDADATHPPFPSSALDVLRRVGPEPLLSLEGLTQVALAEKPLKFRGRE